MKQLLFTLILLIGVYETCPALEITFNQSAEINDAVIKLGDVAKCDEQTPLAEALASQPIGQAPAPGEAMVIRTQAIIQGLKYANRSLPSDIIWSGSPTIHVNRHGILIDAEKITTLIADFIAGNKNNLPQAEIKFVPNSLPIPFFVPRGDLSCDIVPSHPGILGSSSLSIIFKVDDKVVKNMSVRGKIEALAKIVVAATPLRKGLILRPQHLNVATMDISEIAYPELDSRTLLGMRLSRNVSTGSPVLGSMVEVLPVVKRGQKVHIIIDTASLHLTATGLAHSDGIPGQMIRVQNINSNKTIFGKVTGPGVVEVTL